MNLGLRQTPVLPEEVKDLKSCLSLVDDRLRSVSNGRSIVPASEVVDVLLDVRFVLDTLLNAEKIRQGLL